jgi:hypothetical protein
MIELEKPDRSSNKVNGNSISAIDMKHRQLESAQVDLHHVLVERGIEQSILGVNPLSISGDDTTSKEDVVDVLSNNVDNTNDDKSNNNDDDGSNNTDDDGSDDDDGTKEEDNADSNDDKNQEDDGTDDTTENTESAGNTDDMNHDLQQPLPISSNISVNVTMPLTNNMSDTTDLNVATKLSNNKTSKIPSTSTVNNSVINVPTISSQLRNVTYPVPTPLTTVRKPSTTSVKTEPTTTKTFTKSPQQLQPKRNKRPVAVVVKAPSAMIAPFHKTLHPIQQHKQQQQQQQHNSVPSSSSSTSSLSCTTKFSLYCSYPISTSIGGVILLILFICYCCCSCCRTNRNDLDTSRGEYRRVTSRFTADAFDDTIEEEDDDEDGEYNHDDDDDAGATYTNGKHVIELQNLDKGKLSIHEVNG